MKRRTGARRPAAAGGGPPPGPGRRRRWLVALLVLLGVGVAFFLVRRPLLTTLGGLLVVSDSLERADAAVVLGGEETEDGKRLRAAIQLYRRGWVRKIVLSGPRWGYGISETEMSLPLALSLGVPRSDLMPVPNSARSTLQEAQLIASTIERRGIRSLYVVTSNYHTRRARRAFLRASRGRLRVLAYPAPDDWFDPQHWWESRDGRKIFLLESLKNVNSLLE